MNVLRGSRRLRKMGGFEELDGVNEIFKKYENLHAAYEERYRRGKKKR